MAITLTSPGNFVAGTTQVANGGVLTINTAAAETVTLPTNVDTNYRFFLERRGPNNITLAAGGTDTLVGDTATTANYDVLMVIRSAAGEWTGALTT